MNQIQTADVLAAVKTGGASHAIAKTSLEQPTPEQPTPEQPAPEQPAPEQPAPEQPAPEQPTPEQPTPEQPTPEQPSPSTDSLNVQSKSETSVPGRRAKHETDVLSQLPWGSLASLLIAIFCCVGSVLVLVHADGTEQTDWVSGYAPPNVILSILNNLRNLALGWTVAAGVEIGWWHRTKTDKTVQDLHYSWTHSTGIRGIITSPRYFSSIALAVIMTQVALADGPLYQSAIKTSINVGDRSRSEPIEVFGAKVLVPSGAMGNVPDADGIMLPAFRNEVEYWNDLGDAINTETYIPDCTGLSCKYGLPAAGFAVDCISQNTSVDFGTSARAAFAANDTTGYQNLTLFSVSFTRSPASAQKNYSSFFYNIVTPSFAPGLVKDGACPTNLINTTCELRPALLNYTVYYTNSSSAPISRLFGESSAPPDYSSLNAFDPSGVTGPDDHGTQISYNCDSSNGLEQDPSCVSWDSQKRQQKGITVIKDLDVNEPFAPNTTSTLEGFYLAYREALTARVSLSYNGSDLSVDDNTGIVSAIAATKPPPTGFCNFTWRNPEPFILRRINTLTLMVIQQRSLYYNHTYLDDTPYAATYYIHNDQPLYNFSTSDIANQTVNAWMEVKDIQYKIIYERMYAAIAVSVVVILGVLPVFWGFWCLPEGASFAPFAVANAIGRLISDHVGGGDIDEVLRVIGRHTLQYRPMRQDGGTSWNLTRSDLSHNLDGPRDDHTDSDSLA